MNRRELFRSAFVTIGAVSCVSSIEARELPPGFDASKDLDRADWKPLFLDAHQNETLIALSDVIIPPTETPGAKVALVNRFLDLLMSAESEETQRAFFAAISYIDGACRQRYNAPFVYLPPEQQVEFLNLLAYPHTAQRWGEREPEFSGHEHFEKLKSWISGAYYNSAIGLKELGWDGSFPHGVFSGCDDSATHDHATQE